MWEPLAPCDVIWQHAKHRLELVVWRTVRLALERNPLLIASTLSVLPE